MEEAYSVNEDTKTAAAQNAMSLFGVPSEDNLIRWQLDLKEDIDRIYHLLKGDQIKEDKDGNISYEPASHDDLKPFNEFGVQMIMNIISFYLNRNTLLSNYSEDRIDEKVLDFGRRLYALIHNRYEEIMITVDLQGETEKLINKDIKILPSGVYVTDFKFDGEGNISYNELPDQAVKWMEDIKRNHLLKKMKMFEMMAGSLVDSVHSAYLRAYKGGERESLRTARTVTQTEPMAGMGQQGYPMQPEMQQGRRFSLGGPRSWGR